ncbi:MAG: hypothetical protein AB7P07_06470 [Hyphomonadaceae bacterium]
MSLYKWLVGIVLTILMVTVLAGSTILFSARDFQFGLREVVPNGLVEVNRILDMQDDIAVLEERIQAPVGEQRALAEQVSSFDDRISEADEAINTTRGEIAAAIAGVEANANVQSALGEVNAATLRARADALAARTGLPAGDQQTLASLSGRIASLQEQEGARDLLYAERASVASQAENLARRVSEERSGILMLQASVAPNEEAYQRVRAEVLALKNLSPWGISAYLAQGHPALLSSILVLLMGALGALLYLFPAYLNRPQPVKLEEVFVRVIFGMCAALAFYVLANATVAGFSMGANVELASTAATLNPFTVSLIGIVAGVLAEDIAAWVRDRGRGVFTSGSGGYTAPPAAAAAASDEDDRAPGGGLVNNQAIN